MSRRKLSSFHCKIMFSSILFVVFFVEKFSGDQFAKETIIKRYVDVNGAMVSSSLSFYGCKS